MSKSVFQEDLEEFISFFGPQETLDRVAKEDEAGLSALMEGCPEGALRVLAVGLRDSDFIGSMGRSEELPDLAEQATSILGALESTTEILEQWLRKHGKSVEAMTGRAMLLGLTPMFDIEAEDIMIRWQALTRDGKRYQSVDSAWTLLSLFPHLGEAVRKGWEGMRKIGWELPDEQVTHYAEMLKRCADTVEALSSFLPAETGSATGEQTPQSR